jgi:hypothetical protein
MYAFGDCCTVAGTHWDAVIPNRILSCEGALIRRADVLCVVQMDCHHGDLPLLGQSHFPLRPPHTVQRNGCTTSALTATMTFPTNRASSIPK